MRLFIQPSWRDAASDHGDWSGESPDDRKRPSHMLGNKANIGAYSDEALGLNRAKGKSKSSIRDRISLADRHFNRIEAMSLELEKEYRQGNISDEEYSYLKPKMQKRLEAAWKRLCKENQWEDEAEDSTKEASLLEKQEENKRSSYRDAKVQGNSQKLLKLVKFIVTNSFTQFFSLSTIVLLTAKMIF